MASNAMTDERYALEPGTVTLYGSFTGGGATACLSLDVDGGSEEFIVGELISGAAGSGTLYRIDDSSGVWDGETSSGAATLILTDITGTFSNNEAVSGDTAGAAVADGTGTAGNIPGQPTDVKGKGIASIEASEVVDAAGVYTITLESEWAGLLSFATCYFDDDTTDDWEVTITSEAVATSKTIDIVVFKSGTASYSATDEKLYFEIVLSPAAFAPAGF